MLRRPFPHSCHHASSAAGIDFLHTFTIIPVFRRFTAIRSTEKEVHHVQQILIAVLKYLKIVDKPSFPLRKRKNSTHVFN